MSLLAICTAPKTRKVKITNPSSDNRTSIQTSLESRQAREMKDGKTNRTTLHSTLSFSESVSNKASSHMKSFQQMRCRGIDVNKECITIRTLKPF